MAPWAPYQMVHSGTADDRAHVTDAVLPAARTYGMAIPFSRALTHDFVYQ
jgi:hypothetical protein